MSDTLVKATQRQPDSLLLSLKELRSIESRRIDTEREEQERLEREQRRAAEEVELRAREQRRAAEGHERARVEAVEHEQRIRLAEAERRARVEAELQLARERLKLEIAAPAPDRHRGGAWGTISIVLVILQAGGLGLLSLELHRRADELQLAQRDQARSAQLHGRFTRTEQSLLLAQARLRDQTGEIRSLKDQLAHRRGQIAPTPRSTPPRPPRGSPKRPPVKPPLRPGCENSDDPICGIMDDDKSRSRAGKHRR